jgi:uncharacterized RDD family membrane protein YckC
VKLSGLWAQRTFHPHAGEHLADLAGAPLASFQRRLSAFVVDFVIALLLFVFGAFVIFPALFPVLLKLGLVHPGRHELGFNFHELPSLILLVLYFSLATYWGNGRTPGKRLWGIRVVSLIHPRVTLWTAVERALGYGASFLELGFGFLQYFLNPNRQTVHDRIAETIVIREKRRTGP